MTDERWAGRRVLVVSSSYPFHRADFHARFVHEMSRTLALAGAQVRAVTPATPEGTPPGREHWDRVDVRRFGYPGLNNRTFHLTGGDGLWERMKRAPLSGLGVPGFVGSMVAATRRAVREFEPDLLVSHWLVPGGLAATLATRNLGAARAPQIVNIAHSSDVHLLAKLRGGKRFVRYVARHGKLAATSPFLARKLKRLAPPGSVEEVQLGVDIPTVEKSQPRTNAPSGGLRLGMMSRLLWNKGIARALDVIERIPDAQLSIAGGGGDAGKVARAIAERRLNATLVGPVLGRAKSAFLAEQDLFLSIPESRGADDFQDNLPVACMEAMAHGVPVVSTRVGALPELIAETGAGLVVSDRASDISSQLSLLDRGAIADMGRKARKISADFSLEASCRQLANIAALE